MSAGARSAHGHVSERGSQSGRVSSSGRDAGPSERRPSGSPVRAAADRAGSDVTTTDHVTQHLPQEHELDREEHFDKYYVLEIQTLNDLTC